MLLPSVQQMEMSIMATQCVDGRVTHPADAMLNAVERQGAMEGPSSPSFPQDQYDLWDTADA